MGYCDVSADEDVLKKGMEKTFVANKKYTKEERKIIIENIIKRLYNNPSEVNRNNNKS